MRRVKAKEFGTTALADGTIVHFDPSRKGEERYLGGVYSEADAKRLVDHGMGEDVGDADDDDVLSLEPVLPNNDAAAERLAVAAGEDNELPQTSTISTLATVAHGNNPLNASPGTGDGISEDDPDAPPRARRGRQPAARKPAARKPAARKATGEAIVVRTPPAHNAESGTNNDPPV